QRPIVDEVKAGSRTHHRIDHDILQCLFTYQCGNFFDYLPRWQHASLYRMDIKVVEDRSNLPMNALGGLMDCPINTLSVLISYRSNGRRRKHAKSSKSFHIRERPGSARGINACNGQGYFRHRPRNWS